MKRYSVLTCFLVLSCASVTPRIFSYLPEDAETYIYAEINEDGFLSPFFKQQGFSLQSLNKIVALYVALDEVNETIIIHHHVPAFLIRKELGKGVSGISGRPLQLMVNKGGIAVLSSAPLVSSVEPSFVNQLQSSSLTLIRSFSSEQSFPFLQEVIIRLTDARTLRVELIPREDDKVARTVLRGLLAFTQEITYLEDLTLSPVLSDNEKILLESEVLDAGQFSRFLDSFLRS